jgi:hypothetical protein
MTFTHTFSYCDSNLCIAGVNYCWKHCTYYEESLRLHVVIVFLILCSNTSQSCIASKYEAEESCKHLESIVSAYKEIHQVVANNITDCSKVPFSTPHVQSHHI